MKKICSCLLAFCLIFSCAGCKTKKEPAESSDKIISSSSETISVNNDSSESSKSSSSALTGFKGMSDEELKNYVNEKADAAIAEVVTKNMNEMEKLKIVYQWLFFHFKYKAIPVDLSNGYTDRLTLELAAEFFKRRKGSCEHYAAAQKVLYERLGYNPIFVEGERIEPKTKEFGEHVWIMIEFEGKNYHVDGLFGGNHTSSLLSMFCVPDSDIESTHKWDRSKYPVCDSEQII